MVCVFAELSFRHRRGSFCTHMRNRIKSIAKDGTCLIRSQRRSETFRREDLISAKLAGIPRAALPRSRAVGATARLTERRPSAWWAEAMRRDVSHGAKASAVQLVRCR